MNGLSPENVWDLSLRYRFVRDDRGARLHAVATFKIERSPEHVGDLSLRCRSIRDDKGAVKEGDAACYMIPFHSNSKKTDFLFRNILN